MITTLFNSTKLSCETPEGELSMSLIETLSNLDEIKKIKPQWETLSKSAQRPNVFFEPGFLLPALEHLAEDEVELICVWEGPQRNQLLLVAPTQKLSRYFSAPIQHSMIWRHTYCYLCTPLVSATLSNKAVLVLLGELVQKGQLAPIFRLSWLDQDSPLLDSATTPEQTNHDRTSPWKKYQDSIPLTRAGLNIKGEYADFLSTIRTKKRKELMRMRRRLAEAGNYRADFISHSSSPAMQQRTIDEFLTLENQGWKRAQGSALASNPEHATYFSESMRAGLDNNQVILTRLSLDEKPVAMLVLLTSACKRAGFAQKIAIDSQFERFSPGSLVVLELTEHVFSAKLGLHYLDSCAAETHPMINSLWRDRRVIRDLTLVGTHNWRNLIVTLIRTARYVKNQRRLERTN